MYQSLVEFPDSLALIGGSCDRAPMHGRNAALAYGLRRLAALAWSAVATCVLAIDANVHIPAGHNALVQAYRVKQVEKLHPHADNRVGLIEQASGLPEVPFFSASESTQCREKPYRFCRDFSQSEFRLTSLRFMVPDVRGLTPKSLTIRRNSVIANYTFR
jgi:hypothetical protein